MSLLFHLFCISNNLSFFRANGTGSQMLKACAKRRRTKAEILEEKLQQERKEQEVQAKLQELEELKALLRERNLKERRTTRIHSPLRQSSNQELQSFDQQEGQLSDNDF